MLGKQLEPPIEIRVGSFGEINRRPEIDLVDAPSRRTDVGAHPTFLPVADFTQTLFHRVELVVLRHERTTKVDVDRRWRS